MPRAACRYRANMLPGFVEGSLLHLALKDCLSLVCSVSGQCHPLSPPPNRAAPFVSSSGCLEGGHFPSTTAFITISPPAEPQSLPLLPFVILPPLHPLLEKGSLVHQLCGWRHIVPCALGGSPVFVSRIVSARHHRRSFMFWGPWSKPRCRPWFLPRTRRPCAA